MKAEEVLAELDAQITRLKHAPETGFEIARLKQVRSLVSTIAAQKGFQSVRKSRKLSAVAPEGALGD